MHGGHVRSPVKHPRTELLSVAGPMLAEMLLMQLASLLSLWLVSRISDGDAAIFAMVNHIAFSCVMLFRIVSMGCGVVVAQHLGGSDAPGAQHVARASLVSNLALGLLCGALLWLGAAWLLVWMKMPVELAGAAQLYLKVLALSLCFEAGNFVISTVLRSHKMSRPTMWLSLVTQLVHFAIALPLMFGWLGLPAWGLMGLMVGSLVSRVLTFVLGLWLWRRLLNLSLRGRQWWSWPAGSLRGVMHVGLPGAGENIAYRLSFMMILAFVAGMGPAALAAHAYTHQLMVFMLLFGVCMGLATEIIVGHCVGAGRLHQSDRVVRSALGMGLVVSLTVSVLIASFGHVLLNLFTQDAHIIAVGRQLLWLCLLLETGRTFNLVVINGLRAAGDVRFPLFAGVSSMFLVAVGLSWWLGVHLGYGLVGIWLACALDEWLRGLTMYWRWRTRLWRHTSRQVHRNIRRQVAS